MFRSEFDVFVVIMEEKSLSRAADRLDKNQGALSKALQKLERDYQQALFVRTNRGLVPTREAQRLYDQIQMQRSQWQAFRRSGRAEISGHLRIGGHETLFLHQSDKIAELIRKFPSLDLDFRFDRSPAVIRMVLNHDLDLAFAANPQRFSELVIKPIEVEDVALFSPIAAPTNWLIYNPDLITSAVLIKRHRLQSNRLLPVQSYEVAAQLASQLKAKVILPKSVADRHKLKNQLGKPLLRAEICLVYRADHRADPRVAEVARTIVHGSYF